MAAQPVNVDYLRSKQAVRLAELGYPAYLANLSNADMEELIRKPYYVFHWVKVSGDGLAHSQNAHERYYLGSQPKPFHAAAYAILVKVLGLHTTPETFRLRLNEAQVKSLTRELQERRYGHSPGFLLRLGLGRSQGLVLSWPELCSLLLWQSTNPPLSALKNEMLQLLGDKYGLDVDKAQDQLLAIMRQHGLADPSYIMTRRGNLLNEPNSNTAELISYAKMWHTMVLTYLLPRYLDPWFVDIARALQAPPRDIGYWNREVQTRLFNAAGPRLTRLISFAKPGDQPDMWLAGALMPHTAQALLVTALYPNGTPVTFGTAVQGICPMRGPEGQIDPDEERRQARFVSRFNTAVAKLHADDIVATVKYNL